ncbi:uncharacterized protein K452DRAFT_284068 [Aplosporella prunicola CBS 121167]|uniref:Uncharacterized protein n=1 Tax=Aplosporella prunicola CBS 121167 TaxID=1176127 RepID=A0A6A6BQX2_9PEZI|nr:uncharacterized protein K452DRAFT_284068 [Aplosporella prunicola CBS 121167]KAF2145705.1 hypothetical protein K452DRAFT_284068 [Aplosporella prunicola CBS 121167]
MRAAVVWAPRQPDGRSRRGCLPVLPHCCLLAQGRAELLSRARNTPHVRFGLPSNSW